MKNERVRISLMHNRVFAYELAERLNISPQSLSTRMRKELPEEKQDYLISVIQQIAEEKKAL